MARIMHIILYTPSKELPWPSRHATSFPYRVRAPTFQNSPIRSRPARKKIVTKNGESYVALIDAKRLDYYHQLEREHIHLLLLDDARRGVEDIATGRTEDADATLARLQQQRTGKSSGSKRG